MRKARIAKLEQSIGLYQEGTIKPLLAKYPIDTKKCVLEQLPGRTAAHIAHSLIQYAAEQRDTKYQKIMQKEPAACTDKEIMYLFGDEPDDEPSEYLTNPERIFMNNYDAEFTESFFTDNDTASKSYYRAIDNPSYCEIRTPLSEFN